MPLENIGDVIRSGMNYERTRVEVASYNLAIANVAIDPDGPSPLQEATFASQIGLKSGVQTRHDLETRTVLDPGHPMADAQGMVHYPKVDAAHEMATLVSATRAYEANIRAYNSLREMTLKAFEIGK